MLVEESKTMTDIDDTVYAPSVSNEYEQVLFEDGHLIVDDSSGNVHSEDETLPDDWIDKNQNALYSLWQHMQDVGAYTGILDTARFADVCEYMDYVQKNDTTDTHSWNARTVHDVQLKCPKKMRPKMKVWMRHVICDLYDLYESLQRMFDLSMGGFETFAWFAFDNSTSSVALT